MKSGIVMAVLFLVWVMSGISMYEIHKNDYMSGYASGYQARINYEK